MRKIGVTGCIAGLVVAPLMLAFGGGSALAQTPPFLHGLTKVSTVGSTVPAHGDVNPYGVAVVGTSTGALVAGDVLVSNCLLYTSRRSALRAERLKSATENAR